MIYQTAVADQLIVDLVAGRVGGGGGSNDLSTTTTTTSSSSSFSLFTLTEEQSTLNVPKYLVYLAGLCVLTTQEENHENNINNITFLLQKFKNGLQNYKNNI